MNISNYQNSGGSRPDVNQESNLFLARSSIFYGLEYVEVEEDKNSINRGVISTPNFIFYNNNNKVLIDFSDKSNANQQEIVDFWNLTQDGITFTISNAQIYLENTKQSYDLSGIYTFRGVENKIIFADVNTVNNLSTTVSLYTKNSFSSTLNFKHTSIISTQKQEEETLIINHFGVLSKNSFSYLGAYADDYIQLQSKPNKYKIKQIKVDSEGKEIVTVYGRIAEEDRIDVKTFVGLHVRKNNNLTIPNDLTDSSIGSCTYSDENGIIVACLDNNTEYQCKLRQHDSRVGKGFVRNAPCYSLNNTGTNPTNELELLRQLNLIREPQNS